MMSKILQRKLNSCIRQESMTHHHDDEDLLKKTLKNIKASQLHYLFFLLLTVTVAVMRSLALQNKFSTPDLKYIASVFCDSLTDNLSAAFQTSAVLLNLIGKKTVQYIWEWTPVYEGADAFLSDGALTVFCTVLCLQSIGAVHFIAILLLIAGIEPNPGPNSFKSSQVNDSEQRPNEDLTVTSSETSPHAQFLKSPEPSPDKSFQQEWVFTNKTKGEVKLSLKDIENKEAFEKLIDEVDQTSDLVHEIDLCLSTYCSSPWSEHPDGEANIKRLLTHPKLQFTRQITSDMCDFSAQDRGGLSVSLDQKLLTMSDFKMLIRILEYVMSTLKIPVNSVDIRNSSIDRVPWGEHQEGLEILNEFLTHPRILATSNLRMDNIGLTGIPKSLATSNRAIISLNISNNKINKIDQLPRRQSLVNLDLSGNQLTTLPETLVLPNLETLNLEWNPFYEIPAVLNQLPKLNTLTIGSPETRTINRVLLDDVYGGKINIHVRNCREELRAPTVEQLESKRELKSYMDQYDKKCQRKHKKLIGMSSRNLII